MAINIKVNFGSTQSSNIKVNFGSTQSSVMTNFILKGGRFYGCKDATFQNVDWERIQKNKLQNLSNMFSECVIKASDLQTYINFLNDDATIKVFIDNSKVTTDTDKLYVKMPDGFTNSSKSTLLSKINFTNYRNLHITIDCNDLLYTGLLFGWTSIKRLTLINTKQLLEFYNVTSSISIDAFDCDSLVKAPYNGVHNDTTTLGGFINLGKGFKQNGTANYHFMYFDSYMQNLSRESLLNIFNGLYDLNLLDFTFENQPTIKLGSKNFQRIDEADIKIATDKGWIVTV